MTEQGRWRRYVGVFVGSVAIDMAAVAFAIVTRSRTLMILAVGFMPVFAVALLGVLITARNRGEDLVPPHLQGLDHDRRRLVSYAVHNGVRVEDPTLAQAVIAHARNQRKVILLLLVSGTITVSLRIAALASRDTGLIAALDVGLILGCAVLGTQSVLRFKRANRAIAANRRPA